MPSKGERVAQMDQRQSHGQAGKGQESISQGIGWKTRRVQCRGSWGKVFLQLFLPLRKSPSFKSPFPSPSPPKGVPTHPSAPAAHWGAACFLFTSTELRVLSMWSSGSGTVSNRAQISRMGLSICLSMPLTELRILWWQEFVCCFYILSPRNMSLCLEHSRCSKHICWWAVWVRELPTMW